MPHSAQIEGGHRLIGSIDVAGSKIYSVPVLAISLLCQGRVAITNLPEVEDVFVWLDILERLNVRVSRGAGIVIIDPEGARSTHDLPGSLIEQVHGTVYLLPAMLARFGSVVLSPPFGGCQIGQRPVDHILAVMQAFGAKVEITSSGQIRASAATLHGCQISARYRPGLDKFRSGMTKAAIILGVVAQGETTIQDAYHRSSIKSLASFVRTVGGSIEGEGTSIVRVAGGCLGGGSYTVPGDYLEALTFASLAGITNGRIDIHGFDPDDCRSEITFLKEIGMRIDLRNDGFTSARERSLCSHSFATDSIDTDIQPLFSALLSQCAGTSTVHERVWEGRFAFAYEMLKLGADIHFVDSTTILVHGPVQLHGGAVHASDLRGAAALIAAAAAADGDTTITGLSHLARGYSAFFRKLGQLRLVFRVPEKEERSA